MATDRIPTTWPAERQHHPWCNDHNPLNPGPVAECSMCPGLFRDHPLQPGDTPDTLMARHFPNNRRVGEADAQANLEDGLWVRVSFSVDTDELGNCSICGWPYEDCPCPGPTMSELYEYEERDGVLYARLLPENLRG